MSWWQIALIAVVAIVAIYVLRTIIAFARLSPEQRQALDKRSAWRKQIEAYEKEIAAGIKQIAALRQHSQLPNQGGKNLSAIWTLQREAGRVVVPAGFEEAHRAYLQYLNKLHKEWERDPHEKHLQEQSEEAEAQFMAEMMRAFGKTNDQYLKEVIEAHS